MYQVAEEAVLSKNALRLAKHTWYHRCGSDSVEVWRDVCELEFLDLGQLSWMTVSLDGCLPRYALKSIS